ncbi:zinc finger protein 467-like [Lutzomyia longipalpis]|uniref:zinc finger protein 467-like n=1 Tax=Lutzomyia longipalpis TaxID=7200 RepID=UPI002483D971|nr:zinc finger protein 467-like [Lutzomyia longipalpis]
MECNGVKGSDFIIPPFCVKQEGQQFTPISPPDFMFVDHFLGLDPANMSMKLMSLNSQKQEHYRGRVGEPAGGHGGGVGGTSPAGGAPVKKEPPEEGGKVYQCPVCMRMFTNSYHLKRHHLIHTGEKPYVCTMCQMKFNRNEHLKRHILTHTNSRPFLCPACQKTFTRNEYLKRHKMIHTGERPYKCIFCSNRFSRNDHLKKHLARIHKVTQQPAHPVPFMPHHLPPSQPLSLVTTSPP